MPRRRRNQTYKIQGTIRGPDGQGLANLQIKAWDDDVVHDDLLGETQTDSGGIFEITFPASHFADSPQDSDPDIFLEISGPDSFHHKTRVQKNRSAGTTEIDLDLDLPSANPSIEISTQPMTENDSSTNLRRFTGLISRPEVFSTLNLSPAPGLITRSQILDPLASVFGVNGLRYKIDTLAQKALRDTAEQYKPDGDENDPQKVIPQEGNSAQIQKVTQMLNQRALDNDVIRLLLSNRIIYGKLLLKALQEERIAPSDTLGIYNSVVRNAADPQKYWVADLLDEVTTSQRIDIGDDVLGEELLKLALNRGIPLRPGKVVPAVLALVKEVNKEGRIPLLVAAYLGKGEINPALNTPELRQQMVEQLLQIGVKFPEQGDIGDRYDEYFALAFLQARRQKTADDPIDSARNKGSSTDWDFTVDTFESYEEQGIIPRNIKAAGALDYIFYIGEVLQVFNVADALVLRWASGTLDIPDGPAASALYRYHKLRDERASLEERAMLYRRIFNRGNARLLSNMMPNREFSRLWGNLMQAVAEYISKTETASEGDRVSREPIYQIIRQLQYNLTEYMTGMAHVQTAEMYAHLQEAMEILQMEDIVDHFGGRRKSIWRVIEEVIRQDFGQSINVSAIRILGVEGNRIFNYIANFEQYRDQLEDFQQFLRSAEAWIFNQPGEMGMSDDGGDDDDGMMADDVDMADDDDPFADWDD